MAYQSAAPLSRVDNQILQDQEIARRAESLASRPTHVWFALTGRCNLACTHCPRIPGVSSDVDMSAEVYARVRDQVLPLADEVNFGGNNLGEQTLHKEFLTALADIRAAGCRAVVTTNGTKLDEAVAGALASQGARLRISVEGVGETYQQVRGFKWDKLMKGLRTFQQAAHDHPDAGATLEFGMTVFAGNVHQIEDLIRTARDLEADKVFVGHLLPKNEDQRLQSLFFHRSSANQAFEQARQIATALNMNVTLPGPIDSGSPYLKPEAAATAAKDHQKTLEPCHLPWTTVNILENGDVLPCPVTGGALIMGNLGTSPFDEIWNGPAYRRLRKTVNSNKPHPVCAACALRGGTHTDTFDVLLGQKTLTRRLQSSVKRYLLRSKRKKTLARLTRARDAVNRVLARL
jgi:radical SAM protein with 4Fe4S-binding SPASM domain